MQEIKMMEIKTNNENEGRESKSMQEIKMMEIETNNENEGRKSKSIKEIEMMEIAKQTTKTKEGKANPCKKSK